MTDNGGTSFRYTGSHVWLKGILTKHSMKSYTNNVYSEKLY